MNAIRQSNKSGKTTSQEFDMKHIAQNRIQTGTAQSVVSGEVITPTRQQRNEARKAAQKIGHPEGKQLIANVLAAFGGHVIGYEARG